MILPLLVDGALAGSVMIKKAPIIVAPPKRCITGDPPLLELPLSKKIKDKKELFRTACLPEIAKNNDFNAQTQTGAGKVQAFQKKGLRLNTSSAFLKREEQIFIQMASVILE